MNVNDWNSAAGSNRMQHVDAMRGIASVAVAWFHFTCGNPAFLSDGPLKYSGMYGWAGVEMFFVISGFIIPYTLHRGGYSLALFPRFLGKRLIRLDPPYLVGIGIVVGLGFLSSMAPGFMGEPYSVTWRQLLVHLGYVNAFLDETWLNPVYWTLAIEFQYYLLIGVVFPLITARRRFVRGAAFTLLAAMPFVVPSEKLVFHFLPLFLTGVTVFYYRTNLVGVRVFVLLIGLLSALTFVQLGAVVTLVGGLSAALLVFDKIRYPRALIAAGAVSYSLYLLHVPIGGRVINLSLRLPDEPSVKIAALALAMALTFAVAWLLYITVERPAQGWSSRIPLRARKSECAPEAVTLPAVN